MSEPELTIIITHFKNPQMLELCLSSILKSLKNANFKYEILISDSMTDAETKRMVCDRFSHLKFIEHPENVGYSVVVNDALKISRGEYILILNCDVIPQENSIEKMFNYIKDRTKVGMVGPKLLHFNEQHQQSIFRYYTPSTILARRTPLGKLPYFKRIEAEFLMKDVNHNEIQTPDWIMGSSMMISRTALEKVGLMDNDNFFMYFEDVDWCRRFWDNGFVVVYYPNAIMYHYLGRGSKSKLGIFDAIFNKKTHWHIKSAINFFWKYSNTTSKKSS